MEATRSLEQNFLVLAVVIVVNFSGCRYKSGKYTKQADRHTTTVHLDWTWNGDPDQVYILSKLIGTPLQYILTGHGMVILIR